MVVLSVGTLDAEVTDEDMMLLLVMDDGWGEGEAVVTLDGSTAVVTTDGRGTADDPPAAGIGIATGAEDNACGWAAVMGGGLGTPRGVMSPLAEGDSVEAIVLAALRSALADSTAVHHSLTS